MSDQSPQPPQAWTHLHLAVELPETRQQPRRIPSGVFCPVGRVVDLSAGGMQLLVEGATDEKPGDTFDIQLHTDNPTDLRCRVDATVVWIEQVNRHQHVYGIQFVNVSPQARRQIDDLLAHACSGGYDAPVCFVAA